MILCNQNCIEYLEVKTIKYMFWNLYKKNLIGPLIQIILENDVDIVALVETEKLDVQGVINALKLQNQEWKILEICPEADIRVLAKRHIPMSVYKEDKRYAVYKIFEGEETYLLSVLHLSSPMYLEEYARDQRAVNISRVLRKIEESIFEDSECKSIVVGDFNLQPYSLGISSVHGFNATMSITKAKKKFRKVEGETKLFYFNPTWKLMGDNKIVQGTYYNNGDQQEKSIFWYSFDELLIRPYFIDRFDWDYFGIIEKANNYNFINNAKIDKSNYSDHLPIKFEIR